MREAVRIGKRGALTIPSKMRRRFGMEEGSIVVLEDEGDGIRVRSAAVLPVETYSPERKAGFLLSNAVDDDDYARAREDVRALGLDPDSIQHQRP